MTKTTARDLLILIVFLVPVFTFADTFTSDGVDIYYTVEGEGEPVVLIHGFSASAQANFGTPGITSALASSFKVISIDNRGHGASGKPHDKSAYGIQMVEDVINLLDYLDIERSNVVGYSMGGLITQKLVTMYPERVIKAVSGGAGWAGEDSIPLGGAMDELADSLESGRGFGPLFIALAPVGQPAPSAEQIEAQNQFFLSTNDPLALAAAVRGFGQLNNIRGAELQANKVPILYVVGDLDPLKVDVGRAIGAISNAKAVTIPSSDHMTAIVHPLLLESIQSFLAESTQD
jgi:pimeloyl-ACP methyl ester carboxylesterase